MKFAKDILQTNIDESKYDLEKYDKWWENDTLTEKEHYLDALGDGYKSLGIHTSFLEDEKSKKWFGKAAKNKNNRLRLELDDPSYFDDYNSSNLPAFYNRALNLALLSGNDEVIQKVGEDAYKMDEEYLEHWDDPIEIFQYYNAKLEASIILNNNTQQELLEKYRESLEKGEFKRGEISLGIYEGFIENNSEKVYESLRKINKLSHEAVNRKKTNPLKYIDTSLGALYALARKRGMKIELKNDRIPQVLIPEVDTSDSDMVIISGFDEVKSEDNGYKVTEYFRHPGGRNIEKDDLPDTEHGQYMSEDWVRGTIQDMKRDPEENELAQNLEKALKEGRLDVEFVVFQKEKEGYLIDESLSELRIDSIDIRKDG